MHLCGCVQACCNMCVEVRGQLWGLNSGFRIAWQVPYPMDCHTRPGINLQKGKQKVGMGKGRCHYAWQSIWWKEKANSSSLWRPYLHCSIHTHTHMWIYICMHAHIHVHKYTCTHTHTHIPALVYTHAPTHTCISTCVHICIPTYLHLCAHTYAHTQKWK